MDKTSLSYQTERKGGIVVMNHADILRKVDHTLLKQTATWEQIRSLCDDAIRYQTASVCIPPCYVRQAKEYVRDQMRICTVIGFPNGNTTTAVKAFETKEALDNGADEIDMVINIGALKEGNDSYVQNEIRTLKEICGSHILKVIIETCLLTEEEKIRMCRIVTQAGADFIKTSTGFSKWGAKAEDVKLMAQTVAPELGVKAAGGIKNREDALKMVENGATRLGTSRGLDIVK